MIGMSQIELYELTQKMKPKQAIHVKGEDMRSCTKRQQSSLLFASDPSQDEVLKFTKLISRNWGLAIEKNVLSDSWTIRKL